LQAVYPQAGGVFVVTLRRPGLGWRTLVWCPGGGGGAIQTKSSTTLVSARCTRVRHVAALLLNGCHLVTLPKRKGSGRVRISTHGVG